ncbi:MAG: hypothetical protein N3B01_12125, partial [Verrucomicrobiae bacterium]|nr:hypothetical protein [Verrucomicrobiae bacterium]
MNRRDFLKTGGLAILSAAATRTPEPAAPARKPPFRLLYSNDTTNIVSCVSPWHKKREPFRPEMLEASVDEAAGTDVHILQPGLGWIPWWKSNVYPADEHYRWVQKQFGTKPDSFGQYMLAGGDIVKIFIQRCRQHGQSPFISLRLNDAHHLEKPGSVWISRFIAEHPHYRIGPDLTRPEQRVLNWAIPEVRAHKLALIRELCHNYDFDGFELDFMRFYSFFQLDKTTSAQRRQIMTDFVRDVRTALGPHRWLCARLPSQLTVHDALGIDLPAMVAAGLNMVNLSASYFTVQQTDLATIRNLIPETALYLELCHSIWNGPKPPGATGYDTFPFRRTTVEQLQTTAHLAYQRGADGISLFNFAYYREHGGPGRGPFGEPPFEILARLRNPAWLARQPQHWFLAQGWRHPYSKETILPRKLTAEQTATFNLDIAPLPHSHGRLRIQTETALGKSRWLAHLNHSELAPTDEVSEPFPNPYPT